MKYNNDLKIGIYRFDYADGGRHGKWTPNYNTLDDESVADCNAIINKVIKQFPNLDSIQEYCNGIFSSDTKFIEDLSTDLHNYCIRLYPAKGEYNCYIYIYKKEQ